MHLVIDARLYGLEHAGLGRYLVNLLDHLWPLDTDNHYTLLLRSKYVKSLMVPNNVTKILADARHYSLKEQFLIPRLLNQLHPDLVHFPHFNVPLVYIAPFVVTIHDILWHHIRGSQVTTLNPFSYAIKYQGYRLVMHHAVTASQHILVPSRYVKSELAQEFPQLTPTKVTVTYEGVADTFYETSPKIANTGLQPPFLLYIGSCYPHKNVAVIFQALRQEALKNMHLTIVSSRDIFQSRLHAQAQRLGVGERVHFLGPLSDQDLAGYLKSATALIHPSRSEGFGLTGLEAMATGTPVIAAHTSALPEIYGHAALWFDPDDVSTLVKHLTQIQVDSALRRDLIARGHTQVKKYAWATCARQTLTVYQKIYAKNG